MWEAVKRLRTSSRPRAPEAPAERVVAEQLPNRDGQCSGVLGRDEQPRLSG